MISIYRLNKYVENVSNDKKNKTKNKIKSLIGRWMARARFFRTV